jgi:hypothetical protein
MPSRAAGAGQGARHTQLGQVLEEEDEEEDDDGGARIF